MITLSPARIPRRRTLALAAVVGLFAAAAPAQADPVLAGPAVPDELAVLTVGGALATPVAQRSDQVSLQRVSTATGAYRGRIVFPIDGATPLTVTTAGPTSPIRNRTLRRSVDGRYLTFTGVNALPNVPIPDTTKSTAVRVSADGTWVTDAPFGSGYLTLNGQESVGTVTVDGSRYWAGVQFKAPATIAPGDTALTPVSAPPVAGDIASTIDIVDGSLVQTTSTGISRLPLSTTADTTTVPQTLIALPDALDSVFVDTDAVAGADTAYVARGVRGLWKYVLSGGTWKPAGDVIGNFAWVAARAVAGSVEIYGTDTLNTKVQKVVDTAPAGANVATTGVTTLAVAPAGTRYAGLAFEPGTGFGADATPYPAATPTITTSATTLDTTLGASPPASVTIDVADANTPVSDLTVTATSNSQTILPSDKIVITGTGNTRTVTFDPITAGTAVATLTVKAGADSKSVTVSVKTSGASPDATGHYYSGAVDLSGDIDVGDGYFLGISDEVNVPRLYKKGVSGAPVTSFPTGFPGGEGDFEGATRFGDTVVWTGSHGNNRSGSVKAERRYLAFETITGSGHGVDLTFRNGYTQLWAQWKAWDAANGHGLGANYLKFNTATVPGLIPNAPNGFNVEGLTMAPGSVTTAWFGMRAPTITGADGIERALILPVTNIDKLTSDAVPATFGQPILLNLGGRSIRDISKNAHDQYLIEAGTGDTDDSLKNWALYTWDGNPDHDPQFVNELPTDEARIGAWEGIAEVPDPLVAGSKALLTADSGDTGLAKTYGQYVTIGEPAVGPAAVTNVVATGKPGALDTTWDPAARATRYFVTIKDAAGVNAPGSPLLTDRTNVSLEGLTAGKEYTVIVRSQNVATRSVNSTAVKVTPTQGARAATTTTLEFVGSKVVGESQKLIAAVSDPGAKGTVAFFASGSQLQDSFTNDANGPVRNVAVVDGKATLDITDSRSPGVANLQAKFTTANPENFLSSDSATTPTYLEYKPKQPRAEIVSITGDRVVGSRLAIKVKLYGYKPSELWRQPISTEFDDRVNGAAARTRIVGDTTSSAGGYVYLDENGEATIYTTALVAGKHRLSGNITYYSLGYNAAFTDEVPITIAPAAPAPAVPELKKSAVAVVLSGPGLKITNQPVTMTAKLSDPTLTGTVQFFNGSATNIGTPVPVVNGVATYTGVVTSTIFQVIARFDPSVDFDTSVSSVSYTVPLVRSTTELPYPPATASTTTLSVTGDRVAGSPLTANVNLAPVSADPLALRDMQGYIEVLDGDKVVGFGTPLLGKATITLSPLGAGTHALTARFVGSDPIRTVGSVSAAENVTVVVKTDTAGTVGGSVGATLALTLGAPASFGAFTPGVAKDYTTSTTATVVSTAGDAALTVSDLGHLMNGTFSLPSPLEVSFSKSAWSAPASNDVVTVGFKQHIGATDAVRTGTYSKTLTFTLSTTTP